MVWDKSHVLLYVAIYSILLNEWAWNVLCQVMTGRKLCRSVSESGVLPYTHTHTIFATKPNATKRDRANKAKGCWCSTKPGIICNVVQTLGHDTNLGMALTSEPFFDRCCYTLKVYRAIVMVCLRWEAKWMTNWCKAIISDLMNWAMLSTKKPSNRYNFFPFPIGDARQTSNHLTLSNIYISIEMSLSYRLGCVHAKQYLPILCLVFNNIYNGNG